MSEKIEKQPSFKIEPPQQGDEAAIASMHVQSWKETYITPESGLTDEMVDEFLTPMMRNYDRRRKTIAEALANPELVLYRVVKNDKGEIVGFMHASKQDDLNKLEGIYLLNEVKGAGVGDELVSEFLAWADKTKPSQLQVFSFNHRAINFYNKYGFMKVDDSLKFYKDKLPYFDMIRPAEEERVR